MKTTATFLLIAVAAAATSTACGSAETRTAETTTAVVQATPTSTAPIPAAPSESSGAPTAPPASAAPKKVPMPSVVCMNLQAAQDQIQAAGVFFSRSEDATGAGRMQVMDRNWVVVSQTPGPGEPVGEGEAVLSVVKIGEPGDCS
ncbi:PASTA domain-containing protein [Nocardia cyriacigeorgica]|uniref:PASTA domain-containing protein n=1 Tax=Nocardia cyriacigeorgica TaxID=135487 RepID=UPI0013CF643B|nr:hypothetical protein [Nocardia cyriacigeorgica]NEW29143.1 hypothetical protein [Nocardia cyriacigeorgica]